MFRRIWQTLQFRLSSALMMMITASVLVGLNTRPAEAEQDASAAPDARSQPAFAQFRGWPISNTTVVPFYG